ncbi:MAG: flagellar biosynthetic protein FliO [Austwickia sp.]|nr:MAG: flagellar biosynthetic protein FliO [Austwickia sp.]
MSDGSAVVLLVRMTVSLAVVLGLVIWAARVVNRRHGLAGRPQRSVPITVLARQALGRHAGLSVVQVGEDILVLGVTDGEVTLLSRMDPAALPDPAPQDLARPDRDDAATPAVAGPLSSGTSFATALRHATGLTVRRDVKRQGAGARAIAERVSQDTDRGGGRHRG